MGMYTGLRCKVIIKKEYIDDIKELLNKGDWKECSNSIFKEFGEGFRASFIPYGSLAYMPDCWEEPNGNNSKNWWENVEDSDGFERAFYPETGLWCFQCSLKNSDIEKFINNVLSIIVEKIIHLESLYEECDVSTLYSLENNKIIELDYGIRYGEEDDYCVWGIKENLNKKDENIKYENYNFSKENKCRIGEKIN